MSTYGSITAQLDRILAEGGITAWSDANAGLFLVTTSDGKTHIWHANEARAFWAGWCARGTAERIRRERAVTV